MKVARIKDPSGNIQLVTPLSETEGEVLEGNIIFGLTPTGRTIEIVQWLSPVEPADIYCIGLNYRRHAEETGLEIPESPVVFMKPSTALAHPNAPIVIPAACTHGPEVDFEAELAVIIGRTAKNVSVENALDHVLGYTCANDVSSRKWQMHGGGGQWVRSKSWDSFCPLGPVLITADEIPDPNKLAISLRLNGELMQSSNTSDMIFNVPELIAFLSRDTTLRPGTAILTGTPEGVGFTRKPPVYLKHGDHTAVEIEAIGTLHNDVVDPREGP
ncbi:MAG: fumarylacetoacetate hydrolase family protein [Gammaproteobacteria bacterium]